MPFTFLDDLGGAAGKGAFAFEPVCLDESRTGCHDNTFTGNVSDGSATGSGFALCGASRNTFADNRVSHGVGGFWIAGGATDNVVTGNSVAANGTGFGIYDSTGSVLTGNAALDNTSDGFVLGADAASNRLEKNEAARNGNQALPSTKRARAIASLRTARPTTAAASSSARAATSSSGTSAPITPTTGSI